MEVVVAAEDAEVVEVVAADAIRLVVAVVEDLEAGHLRRNDTVLL